MIGFVQITGLDKRGKFRHQKLSPAQSSEKSSEETDPSDETFKKYMDGVRITLPLTSSRRLKNETNVFSRNRQTD